MGFPDHSKLWKSRCKEFTLFECDQSDDNFARQPAMHYIISDVYKILILRKIIVYISKPIY